MKIGKLKAIAAVNTSGVLAFNGEMPWHVSEDLRRFKRLTVNNVVIYGRGTYESFNKQPLPDRVNIVVSKSMTFSDIADRLITQYHDLDAAISSAQLNYPDKDIWIIGGARVYEQTLPIVDELYLTIIKDSEVDFKGELHDESQLLFLPGYPQVIDELFTLSHEEETEYATYKNYKRKATNFRNPTRPFFSKA